MDKNRKWVALVNQEYCLRKDPKWSGPTHASTRIAELVIEAISAQVAFDIAIAWIKAEGLENVYVDELISQNPWGNDPTKPFDSTMLGS